MGSKPVYHVEWVANLLHQFPHWDFEFQTTNSTFEPDSTDYRESIVLLAVLPVACCLLFLLITLGSVCIHCCCKQKPSKKQKTTCIRFVVALFIIFSIGSVAVGFFGNEEGNKGIQKTVDAIQETNDTLSGSLITLEVLKRLTDDVTVAGVNILIDMFNKHLSNVTLKREVLNLADDIKNKSEHIGEDIEGIRSSVSRFSLDKLLDLTQDAEFYRWIGTIVLLCWQVLVLLIYIVATLKKSRCWLVWGITLGVFSLAFVWIVTGAYLGGTVAVSDLCVDPNAFMSQTLEKKVSKDIVTTYLECKVNMAPENFSQALNEAQQYVTEANDTLNKAVNKTLPYNISQYIDGPVKKLHDDLGYAQGNISSLRNSVFCAQIHSDYIKAIAGLCNRSLVGYSLILLVLPILGLSLVIVQCLTPRIWMLLGRRKGWRQIDDTDPFLPRPPPYNSYGAMAEERAPLGESAPFMEDSGREDSVMRPHPHTESTGSDSPPPANNEYYPGSFVQQYNNMGTFPRAGHRQT